MPCTSLPQRQRAVEDVQLVLQPRAKFGQAVAPFDRRRGDQADDEDTERAGRQHEQHRSRPRGESCSARGRTPPATAWCRSRRPSRQAGKRPLRHRERSMMAMIRSPTSAIATTSWRRMSGGNSAVLSGTGVLPAAACRWVLCPAPCRRFPCWSLFLVELFLIGSLACRRSPWSCQPFSLERAAWRARHPCRRVAGRATNVHWEGHAQWFSPPESDATKVRRRPCEPNSAPITAGERKGSIAQS